LSAPSVTTVPLPIKISAIGLASLLTPTPLTP
jgi:hypothetical protein